MWLGGVSDPHQVAAPGPQDVPQAAGTAESQGERIGQQPDLSRVRVVGGPFQRHRVAGRAYPHGRARGSEIGIGAEGGERAAAQPVNERAGPGVSQRRAQFADLGRLLLGEPPRRGGQVQQGQRV